MPKITFNKELAKEVFRTEAQLVSGTSIDAQWEQRVEKLSRLCKDGTSKTHIAFLATAMLAKALDTRVNLFAIKPTQANADDNSFSARTLCHEVIVPLSAELGIHLGVTGREPLNNQPYFRMKKLDDGTPVHPGGQAAFNYMISLVNDLGKMRSTTAVRHALRAFIAVRQRHQPRYAISGEYEPVKPAQLPKLITTLVRHDSEHGKRAQAVVAGLFNVYAKGRIEVGRIHDPSRKHPGDVCVRAADSSTWEKAIEIRDKPVTKEDILIFAKKCVDMGVREAVIVMAAEQQAFIDSSALHDWAAGFGIGLTLFYGWEDLTQQVLFWTAAPKPDATMDALRSIEEQLRVIEASPEAVSLWRQLCLEARLT